MSCQFDEAFVDTKRSDIKVSEVLTKIGNWMNRSSITLSDDEKKAITEMDKLTYGKSDNEYIFETYPCSFLLLCDGNIINGGIMYWTTPYGRKISRSFSSDPKKFGRVILMKKRELFDTNGWYGEQSGAPAHMLKTHTSLSIQPIKDRNIVTKVIGENIIFNEKFEETGIYTRFIEAINKYEDKMLFGKPCMNGRKIGDCDYICDNIEGGMKVSKNYIIVKPENKKRRVYLNANKHKFVIINKVHVLLSSIKGKYRYV